MYENTGACLCKSQSSGPTDALGRTGDKRSFVRKIGHMLPISLISTDCRMIAFIAVIRNRIDIDSKLVANLLKSGYLFISELGETSSRFDAALLSKRLDFDHTNGLYPISSSPVYDP